jgi:hypothetical protein
MLSPGTLPHQEQDEEAGEPGLDTMDDVADLPLAGTQDPGVCPGLSSPLPWLARPSEMRHVSCGHASWIAGTAWAIQGLGRLPLACCRLIAGCLFLTMRGVRLRGCPPQVSLLPVRDTLLAVREGALRPLHILARVRKGESDGPVPRAPGDL